jgi:uncharacterized protein
MKKYILSCLLIFCTLLHLQVFSAVNEKGIIEPMSPPQMVNDFAGMLNSSEKQLLEQKLLNYNDSTTTQIYIVTIDSLGDYPIEEYALQVGRNWGIGQKETDNGVLILIAENDRSIDIEIGYGLESYVTDYDCKRIIDEIITPALREARYYDGMEAATTKLISILQGAPYSTVVSSPGKEEYLSVAFTIGLILLVIILMIRFPILARIAFIVISSGGSSSGSSRGGGGFSGGGGGSFGGGGASGKW